MKQQSGIIHHTRQMRIGEQKRAQIQSEFNVKRERSKKLDSLIGSAVEEKIEGKIPANLCVKLMEKYSTEKSPPRND